ncbi:carbohydrate sulfotransferase 3-like [Glandiceps talaboti]
MENPKLNLKVINIVRDPRSMMSSIIPMYYSHWIYNKIEADKVRSGGDFNESLIEKLKNYCEIMLRNYLLYTANSSRAWKENFLVLRFEDIAGNPQKYAEVMYSHVGIDITTEVYRWIDDNTHLNKEVHGDYTTQRQSSTVVNDWRQRVTFNLIEKIQNYEICREYMHELRYILAENFTMLRNTKVSLFSSLN